MAEKTLIKTHRVWAYVSEEVYSDLLELSKKAAIPPTKIASLAIVAGCQTLKTSMMPEKYFPAMLEATKK